MAWIKVEQSLPSHRKTQRLAELLGVSPAQAVGHLVCLWLWALDNLPDGYFEANSPVTLARVAGWEGDPNLFQSALVTTRFLDLPGQNTTGPAIHNWPIYMGKLAQERQTARDRARIGYEQKKAERERSAQSLCVDSAQSTKSLLNRAEKTREEKNVPPYPPTGHNSEVVSAAAAAFEEINGLISPTQAEHLSELISEYGDATVALALDEARRSKPQRVLPYTEKILERWRREGRGAGGNAADPMANVTDYTGMGQRAERERLERERNADPH